ncbi:MAG: VanZ family protein [Bacilli bacterium]|nr:VanZ family protein [Bacilli bacterium]
MRKKWVFGIITLLLSALIIYTSLNTGETYGSVGGRVGAWVNQYLLFNSLNTTEVETLTGFGGKFIGHYSLFAVTGLFAYLFCRQQKKKAVFAVIFIVYGFILSGMGEITQMFVQGRYPTVNDVIIDFVGFTMIPLVLTLYRHVNRSES